jgi:N-acyl-phosphatidylethanolamine-hydrolysing phospholipase D
MGYNRFHRLRKTGAIIILSRLLLYFALIVLTSACVAENRRVIKNPEMDHWDGRRGRHKNLFPPEYAYLEETEYDRIDFLKPHERKPFKYKLLKNPKGDIDRTHGYDPTEYTVTPDLHLLRNPAHDVQITWIRHASFLIQLGEKYQILIDPVLEQIDGLAGSLGKHTEIGRLHAESPLTIQDLEFDNRADNPTANKTNIVAISHDHLDHLNYNTLDKMPAGILYYVPLGLDYKFPNRFANVTGMDWYTRDNIGNLTITFLPANHRSGRKLNEVNQTLWGGWLFEWNGYRVYFAGDTGYSALFKDIRRRYGEMDVCLMPIAAWFQRSWHFAPEDAVRAAQDLGCKNFIPWGWGTWIMSFEHILEPPRRLHYAYDQMQPENMELKILKMGETYTLDQKLSE